MTGSLFETARRPSSVTTTARNELKRTASSIMDDDESLLVKRLQPSVAIANLRPSLLARSDQAVDVKCSSTAVDKQYGSDEEDELPVVRKDKGKGKAKEIYAPDLPEEVWKRVFELFYDQCADTWQQGGDLSHALNPLLISRYHTRVALPVLYAHPHIGHRAITSFVKSVDYPTRYLDCSKVILVRHLTIQPTRNGHLPLSYSSTHTSPRLEIRMHPRFGDLMQLFPSLYSFTLTDTLLEYQRDAELLFEGLKYVSPLKARLEIRMWDLHGSAIAQDLLAATRPNVHVQYPIRSPSPLRPSTREQQTTPVGNTLERAWRDALMSGQDMDLPIWWIDLPQAEAQGQNQNQNNQLQGQIGNQAQLQDQPSLAGAIVPTLSVQPSPTPVSTASVLHTTHRRAASHLNDALFFTEDSDGEECNHDSDLRTAVNNSLNDMDPSSSQDVRATTSSRTPPTSDSRYSRVHAGRASRLRDRYSSSATTSHSTQSMTDDTSWQSMRGGSARHVDAQSATEDVSSPNPPISEFAILPIHGVESHTSAATSPSNEPSGNLVTRGLSPDSPAHVHASTAQGVLPSGSPDSATTANTAVPHPKVPLAVGLASAPMRDHQLDVGAAIDATLGQSSSTSPIHAIPTIASSSNSTSILIPPIPPLEDDGLTEAQRNRTDHIYIPPEIAHAPSDNTHTSNDPDETLWDTALPYLSGFRATAVPHPPRANRDLGLSSYRLAHYVRALLLALLTQSWTEVRAFSFVACDPLSSVIIQAPLLDFWTQIAIDHIRVHLPRGCNSLAIFKGIKESRMDRARRWAHTQILGDGDDQTDAVAGAGAHYVRTHEIVRVVGGDGMGGGLIHEANKLFEIEVNTVAEMMDDSWQRAGGQLPPQVCRILLGEQDWRDVSLRGAVNIVPVETYVSSPQPSTSEFNSPSFTFSGSESGSEGENDLNDKSNGHRPIAVEDEPSTETEIVGESYDAEAAEAQARRMERRKLRMLKKHQGGCD